MMELKHSYDEYPATGEQMKQFAETLYSRVPTFMGRPFRPPEHIYYLYDAGIGADRLFQAAHSYNAVMRYNASRGNERWTIFGMHEQGQPYVVVAGNSPSNTLLHEAIHYNGVHSETMTRMLTAAYYRRAAFNIGLMRQPVKYEMMPVTDMELNGILAELRLSKPHGNEKVQLVHLKYVPPAR
jgi:hypothetical protein